MIPTLNRLQTEEPQFDIRGPFGGFQSDTAAGLLEEMGFTDVQNLIFRNGAATVRPGYVPIPALTSPAIGIGYFFNSIGSLISFVITRQGLWYFSGTGWIQVPATVALTGGDNDFFTWTVVLDKIHFCQGKDTIQQWDGLAGVFSPVAGAPSAKYLLELNQHLVAASVLNFPERVQVSVAGDTTNWTGTGSAIYDILGNYGPITGAIKIGGQGYIIHWDGVTRMVPTGYGIAPFQFQNFGSKGKGSPFPYSIAVLGDAESCFVGQDNVYYFNGTEFQPIGTYQLSDGSRRMFGAWTSIMAELKQAPRNYVTGFMSSDVNGNRYKAYWLCIPGGSTWVCNLDEGNWTKLVFNDAPRIFGKVYQNSQLPIVRWLDLQGTWAQQTWTWNQQIYNTNPTFGSMLVGFSSGVNAFIDFSNYSETGWTITSGDLATHDYRHNKIAKRLLIVYSDLGEANINVTVEQPGLTPQQVPVTIGGKGDKATRVAMVPFKVGGPVLRWTLAGGPTAVTSIIQVSLVFEVGSEFKNNA